MADKSVRIELRGILELQRAFKQVDKDLPDELKAEFLKVARDVANEAMSKVPSRSGRAAASIKPKASKRGASIAFGGNAAPYFPWLNFGGTTGRGHGPGGGGAIARDRVTPDRYIYSTIEAKRDETRQAVDHALEKVIGSAGFRQSGEV